MLDAGIDPYIRRTLLFFMVIPCGSLPFSATFMLLFALGLSLFHAL